MRGALIVGLTLLGTACAIAEPLPHTAITPGVVRNDLTVQQICTTKWGKDARAVTESMKRQVFNSYGYPLGNKDPRCPCEIDHLISRELGGADDVKNLWPQQYFGQWNAHQKDRVENRLHVELCKGTVTLKDAQHDIATDWTKVFVRYFGLPLQMRRHKHD
jgi:hypothetical protein